MRLSHRTQPGQTLVTVAFCAVVLFMFVGLGIDSSMLYVERRHLQNTTDAACLAAATDLVMGKTPAEARATAITYITDNLGANGDHAFVLPSPIVGATNVGSGAGLTHGVEPPLSGGTEVRVALTLPANTYFMRVGGINTYNVRARTHCDGTHGGGVIPIAVNRFPSYDKNLNKRIGGATTSKTLPQRYGNGKKPSFLTVLDVLQKDDGILNRVTNANQTPATMSGCGTPDDERRNWYDWNGSANNSATAHTGIYHDACTPASEGNPGPEVVMAGSGANPNTGTNSFRGPVALDARDIGTSPTYYNDLVGIGNNLNAWKDSVFKYIYTDYPGPDIPVGTQLGIVNGNSAGQLISAIQKRYDVNDTPLALVYDGSVEAHGEFELSVVCKKDTNSDPNPNCDNDGSNDGKYIYRDAPPATGFFDNQCKYSGAYFVAADGNPVSSANLKSGNNNEFVPAKYVVTLESATAQTIRLMARVSDAAGSGADFGGINVRWTVGTGSPTAWQAPDVALDVALSANTSVDVKLEVIQTATTTMSCTKGSTTTTITVPRHDYGAQTIQVVGASTSQATVHSDYGVLGMLNGSGAFDSGDYFLSFANDPLAIVDDAAVIEGDLLFVDANSDPPVELRCSSAGGTLNCSSASATISGLASGMSAEITAGQGGSPMLRITLDGSTPTGLYPIDVRWNSSPAHSARYLVRVVSPSSPSSKTWVTVVCYARFRITHIDSNELRGRAISGCIDPKTAAAQLKSGSRIRAW